MVTTVCTVHPGSPAAWRCPACVRNLCELCAAHTEAGRGALIVCASCGALAEALVAPRAEVVPFQESWPSALRWLLSPKAIAIIFIITCLVEFLSRVGPKSWLLGHAFALGWFSIVVHRASFGHAPFNAPTYAEIGTSWMEPLARLGLSAGPLALGAAALVGLGQVSPPLSSVTLWLLVGLTCWLLPPALVFACIEGPGTEWLISWQLPEKEKMLGEDIRPIRIVVMAWALVLACEACLPQLDLHDTKMAPKILLEATLQLGATALLAALACMVGQLLRTHGERLGHGDPEWWMVAVAPQAVPRGSLKPRVDPALTQPEPEPIELSDPRTALLDALARNDGDAALAQYRSGEIRGDMLDGEVHIQLAQLMAARGTYELAANHLRGLLTRAPDGAAAPRALVILARLCAERLSAKDEALGLYRRVVEKFPETSAARFARERLEEMGD